MFLTSVSKCQEIKFAMKITIFLGIIPPGLGSLFGRAVAECPENM